MEQKSRIRRNNSSQGIRMFLLIMIIFTSFGILLWLIEKDKDDGAFQVDTRPTNNAVYIVFEDFE